MSTILVLLLQLASLLLVARAILSWLPIGPGSGLFPVRLLVDRLTEPILAPVRRVLPSTGAVDLSVLVVLVLISFVLMPIASSL